MFFVVVNKVDGKLLSRKAYSCIGHAKKAVCYIDPFMRKDWEIFSLTLGGKVFDGADYAPSYLADLPDHEIRQRAVLALNTCQNHSRSLYDSEKEFVVLARRRNLI